MADDASELDQMLGSQIEALAIPDDGITLLIVKVPKSDLRDSERFNAIRARLNAEIKRVMGDRARGMIIPNTWSIELAEGVMRVEEKS